MIKIRKLTLKGIGPFDNEGIDFSMLKDTKDIHIIVGANGTGKTTVLHALASAFDYFEPDHKEHKSNNLHKRFRREDGKFYEDNDGVAKSFAHCIIMDDNDKVVDKIKNYGCKNCGNIHQNFEKTIVHDLRINSSGKNYQPNPQSKDLLYYKNAINSKDLNGKKLKFAAFGYSGYRFIETEEIEIKNKDSFNPLYLALEFVKKKDGSEKEFKLSNWIISAHSKAALEEVDGNIEIARKIRYATDKLTTCINELTDNSYAIKIERNPWQVCIDYCGNRLEFDVLPDGLRSILSWLGDLLMRLDAIPWENNSIPVTEQNIILFLDEIEVHLHPKWQYKILGMLIKLFPNAQIFITTHSPFIINSIDDANIYRLESNNCKSSLASKIKSETGWSIDYVLEHILDVKHSFGYETEVDLKRFNLLDTEIANGNDQNENEFIKLTEKLAQDSDEVLSMIAPKLLRLRKVRGKDYLNGEN